MSGINYKSQINMPVAPTDDNHVTRLKETKKATFDDTLSVVQIFRKYGTPTGGSPYTNPTNFIEAHGDVKIYGSGAVELYSSSVSEGKLSQEGIRFHTSKVTDYGEDIALLSDGSAKIFGKKYTTIQSEMWLHLHTWGNDQGVRVAMGNTGSLEFRQEYGTNKTIGQLAVQDKIHLLADDSEVYGTSIAKLHSLGPVTISGGDPLNIHTNNNNQRIWVGCGNATSLQLYDGDGDIYSAKRSRLYSNYSEVYGTSLVNIICYGDNWDTQGIRVQGNLWVNEGVDNRMVRLRGYYGNELELGTATARLEAKQGQAVIKGNVNPLATEVPAVDISANDGSFVRIKGSTLGMMRFATTMASHDGVRDLMVAMHGLQWEDIICIRVKNMATGNITVGRRNEARFTVGNATPAQAYGTASVVNQVFTNAAMEDFYPARALRGTIDATSGRQWLDYFVSVKGNNLIFCRGDDSVANWGGYAIKPNQQTCRTIFNGGGGTWSGGFADFTFGIEIWETYYRPLGGITAAYGDWNANLRMELWTRR